jgi:hypothetical protein
MKYTVPLPCVLNVGWVGFRPPTRVSWQLALNTLVLSCTLEVFWLINLVEGFDCLQNV